MQLLLTELLPLLLYCGNGNIFYIDEMLLFFYRKQESDTAERVKFKWSAPIKDIEMKDSAITPELQSALKGDIGRMSITSPKLGNNSLTGAGENPCIDMS